MTKFSVKYKKEYLKAKKMLGVKGVKKEHVILGLVALGVIYFVIKKKGGLGGGGAPEGYSNVRDVLGRQLFDPQAGVSSQEFGQYILPEQIENYANVIGPQGLGSLPGFLKEPRPYDVYSGAVGDIQHVPSFSDPDLVPYRRDSEPPYEYGWTYQPY